MPLGRSPRNEFVENFRIFVVVLNTSDVSGFLDRREINSSFSRDLEVKISESLYSFYITFNSGNSMISTFHGIAPARGQELCDIDRI